MGKKSGSKNNSNIIRRDKNIKSNRIQTNTETTLDFFFRSYY